MVIWLALSSCSRPEEGAGGGTAAAAAPAPGVVARARGRQLYLLHCALCHGERADGHGVRREALSTPPADFTSRAWRRRATAEAVSTTIREGVRGTPMPAWKGSLTPAKTRDLIVYLLSVAEEGAE